VWTRQLCAICWYFRFRRRCERASDSCCTDYFADLCVGELFLAFRAIHNPAWGHIRQNTPFCLFNTVGLDPTHFRSQLVLLTPADPSGNNNIPSLVGNSLMYQENRCAQRFAFVANSEVANCSDERGARVTDLSVAGAYLAMMLPFSKDASVLITIRTGTEFFQCHATVAHSTHRIGMGVRFRDISPPFLLVLQEWLVAAIHAETIRG
jgi:hypothetical protein